MAKVFISHATADRTVVVRDIIDLLKDHGVEVWFSADDIGTAHNWERSIVDGLKSCDWFLVALTRNSVSSEWVKDEVHWAIDERPGRIVPVILEDCQVRDVHIRLARLQHVDFRQINDDSRRKLLACWGVEYRANAGVMPQLKNLGSRYSIRQRADRRDFLDEYLGDDALLNRPVLIKYDSKQSSQHEGRRNPVATEVKATAALAHPAIPSVFDFGHDEDVGSYSIMEHMAGTILKEGIRSTADAVDLLLPLCQAAHCAHEHGIIHRNIKPSSVFVSTGGSSLLTNWILAKLPGELEAAGMLVGTPMYMAPEQIALEEIDHRVDIWALGIVLYELLTGQRPFHRDRLGESLPMVLDRIRNGQPKRPRNWNRSIPKSLEAICLKCLEKDPDQRFSTAEELFAALYRWRGTSGRTWMW